MENINDYYNLLRKDNELFLSLIKNLSLNDLLFHHFKCSIHQYYNEMELIENEIIKRFNDLSSRNYK